MQRTSDGNAAGSPLNSVLDGPCVAVRIHDESAMTQVRSSRGRLRPMSTRTIMAAAAVMLSCPLAYAAQFPVVGVTYQLDRTQFPGQVAVCITEQAMVKYLAAKAAKDDATMRKMTM